MNDPVIAAFIAVTLTVFPPVLAVFLLWKFRVALKRSPSLFWLFAFGFILYGLTKTGSIAFPYTDPEARYIFDRGSYVTNDLVHVDFTVASFVPGSAPLYGYVRPAGSTNEEDWVEFIDATFDTFPVPQDIEFPGARTNHFIFFTTWTPGPAAHTNGVAVVYWRKSPDLAAAAAPIRTGIYTNAVRVAPSPAITNSPPFTYTLEVTE